MRTSFANFALVASTFLVKDVFAAPQFAHQHMHKRNLDVIIDTVMVTEEITVTQEADGSLVTGSGVPVGTATIVGTPAASSVAPASSAPAPVIVSSAEPSTSSAAVFIQSPEPTTTAAPATTTAAPVVVPTTTAVAVKPTTFATVASPAPVATVAPVTNSAGKRGLAYNDASLLSGFLSGNSKVTWAYNWGSGTASIPSSLDYSPMLWGLSSDNINGWTSAAEKAIAAGSKFLLSFNEPDYSGQSNLSPSDAAAGYKTYMQPYASKAKLVSPAVTNGGSPMGLTWLSSFISDCSGCTIDAVAIHWYNGGDAAAFKTYVGQAYAAGGNRPLHITEFQASGDANAQIAFLNEVMPFLDSSDMVERYAYFGVFANNLISSGTSLSQLGETFASSA